MTISRYQNFDFRHWIKIPKRTFCHRERSPILMFIWFLCNSFWKWEWKENFQFSDEKFFEWEFINFTRNKARKISWEKIFDSKKITKKIQKVLFRRFEKSFRKRKIVFLKQNSKQKEKQRRTKQEGYSSKQGLLENLYYLFWFIVYYFSMYFSLLVFSEMNSDWKFQRISFLEPRTLAIQKGQSREVFREVWTEELDHHIWK